MLAPALKKQTFLKIKKTDSKSVFLLKYSKTSKIHYDTPSIHYNGTMILQLARASRSCLKPYNAEASLINYDKALIHYDRSLIHYDEPLIHYDEADARILL